MFLNIAHYYGLFIKQTPSKDYVFRTRIIVVAVIDAIIGIALLAIGICAMQLGFLPTSGQFLLIGVGITYTFLHVLRFGSDLKKLHHAESKFPNVHVKKKAD